MHEGEVGERGQGARCVPHLETDWLNSIKFDRRVEVSKIIV